MRLTLAFIAAFISSCTCKTIVKKTGVDWLNHQIEEKVHVDTPIHCKENNTQSRIILGCEAEPHSIPWQVYIESYTYTCGGSVLNEDTILTAAHCCESMVAGDSVFAGKHDIENNHEKTSQKALVTDFIIHPSYYVTPSLIPFNDVCIVKLERRLDMNNYVKAVKLPEHSRLDFDGIAAISGWGRTQIGGKHHPEKLQVARVPLVDFNTCVNDYSKVFAGEDIDQFRESQLICAGNGGEDTCQGDSGGPMMCGDVICGITSFGYGCGIISGVYARVSNYLEFIMKHL